MANTLIDPDSTYAAGKMAVVAYGMTGAAVWAGTLFPLLGTAMYVAALLLAVLGALCMAMYLAGVVRDTRVALAGVMADVEYDGNDGRNSSLGEWWYGRKRRSRRPKPEPKPEPGDDDSPEIG